MKTSLRLVLTGGFLLAGLLASPVLASESSRDIIVRAILADDAVAQREIIGSLAGEGDPAIKDLLNAWRTDALFVATMPDGERVPVSLVGDKDASGAQAAQRVMDGELLVDVAGAPSRLRAADLTTVEHDRRLRRAMSEVIDLVDLSSPDTNTRLGAVEAIARAQDASKLEILKERLAVETNGRVHRALREGVALIGLADPAAEAKIEALNELAALHPLSSYDVVVRLRDRTQDGNELEVAAAATRAIRSIDRHRSTVNFFGTLFRGLSLGSILLVVALGLAITFGLMGVINMAHGEMIAVGAYTTYVVQCLFGAGVTLPFFGFSLGIPSLNLQGWAYESYFLFALPLSFLMAALVGIGLERSVIQFLYRRPLESLLATWGVSWVLQQVFRLMFGANNVQVSSPAYLSNNWTFNDIIFGWNRVFVIGFAVLIVFGVWLVLTRTSLGLLIRAVMQNRGMASCMGVRTQRVNMLTFGLGSGLAGLAGAFLSQIGNVGPSLGQSYIIDSFMVVVVGGVGSIAGTVISAFGIGGIDQVLQQYLPVWAPGLSWVPFIGSFLQNLAQDSSVFGKILVLAGIILFLQWRPAGIFVTRSRGLED